MAKTAQPSVADVLVERLRGDVQRFQDASSAVRQQSPSGIHQLRIACRRLRGDLWLFRDFTDRRWATELRDDLRWLAGELAPARDLYVLRQRIAAPSTTGPDSDPPAAIDEVDKILHNRESRGFARATAALADPRYTSLLRRLRRASSAPRLTGDAATPAPTALPALLRAAWKPMDRNVRALTADAPPERWHRARIRAKRTRYAAESAESSLGKPAARLAQAAKDLQDHLGAHQDAVVAADTLSRLAGDKRVRPPTAKAARWLADREEAGQAELREQRDVLTAARRQARRAAKALKGTRNSSRS